MGASDVMDAEPMPPDFRVEQDPGPVDARNAESTADVGMALQIYKNVAVVPFAAEVRVILAGYQTADEHNKLETMYDILPTGELYLAQMFYRRILNEAFGPGGWALVPMDPKPWVQGDPEKKTTQLVQAWALIAHGQYVAEATGGAEYDPKNSRMLWSDACETVKSNAIMRLCKDLGLAGDCWDRRYIQAWKKKYAVHVWVAKPYKGDKGWSVKGDAQWRRVDADPLKHELRPVAEGETSIRVREVSFQKYEEEKTGGQKTEPKAAPKAAVKPADKPAAASQPSSEPSGPVDPEKQPLMALARSAGPGGYFTAKDVVILKLTKKPRMVQGKPKEGAFSYTAHTDNGEQIFFFSPTDANTLNGKIKEKYLVDLNCKVTVKPYEGVDHWFINLEEIVEG